MQTILRFQIFQDFFAKIKFFTVSIPYTAQVRKVQSAKNHSLVLFYSAKSVSDHITISELFQVFFSKNQFFSLFRTLYCKGEKHDVRKKSFLVLFDSAKSNSDHFTISNFSSFFKKLIFFTVSTPYTAQVRKVKSAKNHFFVFFYSAKSISDHFRNSNFFQNFLKNLKFSQYASNGKCVEYAKLYTTQNQRKICKIYAKFNTKYLRSTLYKNCGSKGKQGTVAHW